jgi:hypothetical protein
MKNLLLELFAPQVCQGQHQNSNMAIPYSFDATFHMLYYQLQALLLLEVGQLLVSIPEISNGPEISSLTRKFLLLIVDSSSGSSCS